MKFCTKCGKELVDEAVVCVHCGCAVPNTTPAPAVQDAPNIGLAILGFFFPLIGLILYLVFKDNTPLKAKSAGKGALIGVIVSAVIGVIYGIILGSLLGSILASGAV